MDSEPYDLRRTPIEGYSLDEKISFAKLQQYASCALALISLILMIISWIFFGKTPNGVLLSMSILNSLTFLLAFVSLLFAFYSLKKKVHKKDKASLFGALVFVWSASSGLCYLCLLISMGIWLQYSKDIVGVQEDSQIQIQAQVQEVENLFIAHTVILGINFFPLGYTIFSSYVLSVKQDFIRYFVHFFNIIWVLLSFLCLWATHVVFSIRNEHGLLSIAKYNNLQCIYGLSIAAIILSMLLFLTNYKRYKMSLFLQGSAKLAIIMLLLTFGGLLIREGKQVRKNYIENCPSIMKKINLESVKSWNCPNKYLQINKQFSLDCKTEWLAKVWEDKNAQNKLACLNKKCCNVFADSFAIWLNRCALFAISLAVAGFALVTACYMVAFKGVTTTIMKTKLDWLFGILFLLVLIIGILLSILGSQSKPYGLRPTVLTIETNLFKRNLNPQVYSTNLVTEENPCIKFKKLKRIDLQLEKNQCGKTNQNCKGWGHRISIHSKVGQFKISDDFDYRHVQVFNQDARKDFITEDKGGFIAAQGNDQHLEQFLNNYLLFCPGGSEQSSQFTIDAHQIQLTVDSSVNHRSQNNDLSSNNKKSTFSQFQSSFYDKDNKLLQNNQIKFSNSQKNVQLGKQNLQDFSDSLSIQSAEKLLSKEYKWGSLKLQIRDSESEKQLQGVTLEVFPDSQICGPKKTRPLYVAQSNAQGEYVFHNLIQRQHTIIVKLKGYKHNCAIVTISKSTGTSVTIPMIKQFKIQGVVKLALSWHEGKQPKYNLQLQGTFKQNNNLECSVGFAESSCGNMQWIGKAYSQVITLKQLGEYKYLFYVQKLPLTSEHEKLQKFYDKKHPIRGDNGILEQADPRIRVFVSELDYPVREVYMPILNEEIKEKKIATWLALCLDGKIGETTMRPLNKWWKNNDSGKNMNPQADICEKFYRKHPVS